MKKYLFLLGSFYPNPSANGICIQNICDALVRQGNEVYIICENIRNKDYSILLNGYNVNLISPRMDRRIKYKKNLYSQVNSLLHFRSWPLTSKYVEKNFYRKALNLIDKYEIDNVICVCNPFETIITGKKIKERKPNINLIYYFLDAFFQGKKPKWMNQESYEKRLNDYALKTFNFADKIIFMANHELPIDISRIYKSKIFFLDIPLFSKDLWSSNTPINKIPVFLYVGNFAQGLREPDFLFEVLWKLYNEGLKFKAYFYGNLSDMKLPKYAKKMKELKIVDIKGSISHEDSLKKMITADILINVDSNNSNFIPSKIFEYMSTGKTILNVSDNSNKISLNYLEKYGRFISVNKSDLPNFCLMVDEIENKLLNYTELSQDRIQQLFERNTPEYFIKLV